MTPSGFAPALLDWFDAHGRHDLPWQNPRTPYRVWLSEVMLQQTQVATVVPYFLRFVARFPDLQALASAPVDDVLHHWSGLGYYARARNLQRAAQLAIAHHAGQLPADRAALQALPGIGRSTAGAVMALAYGRREAILDGNVKRVLARWFAIGGWPGEAAVLARLWSASEAVTPYHRVADYTQAIMDLGATVCTRARPRCAHCPVAAGCQALAAGTVGDLPGRRATRGARRVRSSVWLVAIGEAGVYLVRRPARGLWGGLWSPPDFESAEAALTWAAGRFSRQGSPVAEAPFLHRFTHFDLAISPLVVGVRDTTSVEEADALWYNLVHPPSVGLAAPVATLMRRLSTAPPPLPVPESPRSP